MAERRTYADLLGDGGVPLVATGSCAFCHTAYKDNSRVDAPDVHGGLRRYHISEKSGLICDPCAEGRGDDPLPLYRKIEQLEGMWEEDGRVADAG